MPKNTLAPGYIELKQITTIGTVALPHIQKIGVNVINWALDPVQLVTKAATGVVWTTALGALIDLMEPLFTDDTAWVIAELWRQDTPTSDPSFVATTNLTDAGDVVGGAISACQAVFSFRGSDDSRMNFTMLEANQAADQVRGYDACSAAQKALIDYIKGASTWLYTRGNSYPVSFEKLTTKTNDKLRKIRLGL